MNSTNDSMFQDQENAQLAVNVSPSIVYRTCSDSVENMSPTPSQHSIHSNRFSHRSGKSSSTIMDVRTASNTPTEIQKHSWSGVKSVSCLDVKCETSDDSTSEDINKAFHTKNVRHPFLYRLITCGGLSWRYAGAVHLFCITAVLCIIMCILFFEVFLPRLAQNALTNSKFKMKTFLVTNPTLSSVDIIASGTIQRPQSAYGVLHKTNLHVMYFVAQPKLTTETQDAVSMNSRSLKDSNVPGNWESLGSMKLPDFALQGNVVDVSFNTTLVFNDPITGQMFITDFVGTGGANIRLSGEATVTAVRKKMDKLVFDKFFEFSGPKFGMKESAVEAETGSVTGGNSPNIGKKDPIKLMDFNVTRKPEDQVGFDISLVVQLNSTNIANINPLGDIGLELWWNEFRLGEVYGTNTSLTPPVSLFTFQGTLDPLQDIRGLSLFEMVKKLKSLSKIRTMIVNGETPNVNIVGTYASIELYKPAVLQVNYTLPLAFITEDMLGSVMTG